MGCRQLPLPLPLPLLLLWGLGVGLGAFAFAPGAPSAVTTRRPAASCGGGIPLLIRSGASSGVPGRFASPLTPNRHRGRLECGGSSKEEEGEEEKSGGEGEGEGADQPSSNLEGSEEKEVAEVEDEDESERGVGWNELGLADIEYFEPLTREDEPSGPGAITRELPLFPLNLVTCPHGKMPLHIFELRYRQMMDTIGQQDRKFGLVLFDGQKLGAVGTIVEVVEKSMLPDGRQFIMTVGRERFRMLRVIKDKPYMVGLVEAGIEDQEVAPEEMPAQQEAEAKIWTMLQDVVRLSNKVNLKTKVNVSDDVRRFAPGQVAEGGEAERRSNFSFAVAEMFDISPVAKQLLLQTQDVGERLSYQSKWLEKSRAYLAAQATIMDALAE